MTNYLCVLGLLVLLACSSNISNASDDIDRFGNQLYEGLKKVDMARSNVRNLLKDKFETTEKFSKRRQEFIQTKTQELINEVVDTSSFIIKNIKLGFNADENILEISSGQFSPEVKKYLSAVSNWKNFGFDSKGKGQIGFIIYPTYFWIRLYNFPIDTAKELDKSFEQYNVEIAFTCLFNLVESEDGWRGLSIEILKLRIIDNNSGKIFYDN